MGDDLCVHHRSADTGIQQLLGVLECPWVNRTGKVLRSKVVGLSGALACWTVII